MLKENVYYWPLLFSRLLNVSEQQKINKILPELQRAQIYIWRALNIYDDFIDGAGQACELPRANNYLRKFLEIHYQLKLGQNYYHLMDKLFKKLEAANIRDARKRPTANQKIVSLADKSIVLSLGAIALFAKIGWAKNTGRIKAALNFFKNFLALEQLADDSVDWREDLEQGLITHANLPVLMAGQKSGQKIDLKTAPEVADIFYYQYSSPLIISKMKRLCAGARRELKAFPARQTNHLLKRLILPHEIACAEVERFRALVVEA